MYLAKVVGSVVMTQKIQSLSGKKILLCQAVGADMNIIPDSLKVVADTVGSGVNDIVLISQGSVCRAIFQDQGNGIDSAVVGIVDNVNIG